MPQFGLNLPVISFALAYWLSGASVPLVAQEPGAADVFSARESAERVYAERLEKLAARCDQLELGEQAKQTRAWRIPRDPKRLYLFLPAQSKKDAPVEVAGDADRETRYLAAWRKHFLAARKEQADRLVKLAEQALAEGYPDAAYQWLHEALHEAPDHERARAALDYRVVNGRWRLPGGVPRATRVRIANRKFKLPAGHYRIESEHFRLLTDGGRAEGVQAVNELETIYALWRQAFYRYWGNAAQLKQKLDAAAAPKRASRKFSVVLFSGREKYVNVLSEIQPLIAKTVGIYMDEQRTAFFYSGDASSLATRRHEAAHQFFSESIGPTKNVGSRHNFWVVEAIALYMESLQQHDNYYTLGGLNANRTQYARYRAYNQRFYAPLEALTAFSRAELQKHDELRRLYSQSAGLANYFLSRATPTRRNAFLDFVKEVYAGRDTQGSLTNRLGAALKDVDREYLMSLMVSDEDIGNWPATEVENLSLGNTLVTNEGLAKLAPQSKLIWLDLAATEITDEAGPILAQFTSLEQLNLEKTKISDKILPHLARLPNLLDLDLSGAAISGDGLRHLASLDRLQILWLTDTSITDDDLEHLKPLKQLQHLHVQGTSVTPAGLKKLKAALPKLEL